MWGHKIQVKINLNKIWFSAVFLWKLLEYKSDCKVHYKYWFCSQLGFKYVSYVIIHKTRKGAVLFGNVVLRLCLFVASGGHQGSLWGFHLVSKNIRNNFTIQYGLICVSLSWHTNTHTLIHVCKQTWRSHRLPRWPLLSCTASGVPARTGGVYSRPSSL